MNLSKLLIAAAICLPAVVHAGVIPAGIQTNVTKATTTSWGWTECHRSGASSYTSISSVLSACKGDYLMMAYATDATNFAILGAGAYDVVTKITYADYSSDDAANSVLNNWSNGLNFYRTAGYGSWGFTTNSVTQLSSADILLLDGLNDYYGKPEGVASKGMSYHVDGANLTSGWAYNATGNNFQGMSSGQRVFLTYTANAVPEPGILLLLAIGASGIAAARRRRA